MAITNFQKNALSAFWGGALDGLTLAQVNNGLELVLTVNQENADAIATYSDLLSLTESLITSDYYQDAIKTAYKRAVYQIYNLSPGNLTAPTFPDPDA